MDAEGRKNNSARNYSGNYRETIIARIQTYFQTRGATREGVLPGRLEDLEQLLTVLFPDFVLALMTGNPPFSLTRASTGEGINNVDALSSGEAQLLTIGLDIVTISAIWSLQENDRRLLLIDEPDAHIHPDLQVRFADFVVQVADKYDLQVVVATHSTTLLSALGQFAGARCGVVYLDRAKNEFASQNITKELKEIAACLGGHALMGPLFGFPILLVEGDDDYRIWSQVPRHHVTNFAVLPSNGDEIYEFQKSLERVFQSLREPGQRSAGYALIDGDKSLPEDSPTSPQKHVKFIRLCCHEAENLYLTDEVLRLMGTNWDAAIGAIVASSSNHGSKAEKLAQAGSWDRQQYVVDPESWTGRIVKSKTRIERSPCPRNDVSIILSSKPKSA